MYFSKEMQEASLKLNKKWEDKVQKSLKNNPDHKAHFPRFRIWKSRGSILRKILKILILPKTSVFPVNFLICAEIKLPVTGDAIGRSACFPAWAAHRIPTNAGTCSCARDKRA